MTTIVKRIVLIAALAVVVVTARAQFGSYSHDLPFMGVDATGVIGPCGLLDTPYDLITNYTSLSNIDGLTNGCWWNGAYVAKLYEVVPYVTHRDNYDTYTTNSTWNAMQGLAGGVTWLQGGYALHTYEQVQRVHFVDNITQYATNNSFITDNIGAGTNFYASLVTNTPVITAWTNYYVGKGY